MIRAPLSGEGDRPARLVKYNPALRALG